MLVKCDQILLDSIRFLKVWRVLIKLDDLASLASIKLNHDEKYNRLRIEGEVLRGILKYGEHKELDNKTYSGLGIINLSLVTEKNPRENPNFFDFLFAQEEQSIKTVEIDRESFVDVGTKEKYIDFCFEEKVVVLLI